MLLGRNGAVEVNGYADSLTEGILFGAVFGALCTGIQYIVSQWETLAPYPPILFLFSVSVGFTGINFLTDAVFIVLVFMVSLRSILFWIKHAWYLLNSLKTPLLNISIKAHTGLT